MTENGGNTFLQNVCKLVPNYMVIVGHRRQNLTSHVKSECGIGRHDFAPHYDLLTFFKTTALQIKRKQTWTGGFNANGRKWHRKNKMLKDIRTESCKPRHMESVPWLDLKHEHEVGTVSFKQFCVKRKVRETNGNHIPWNLVMGTLYCIIYKENMFFSKQRAKLLVNSTS
jgi:hypothetical protein